MDPTPDYGARSSQPLRQRSPHLQQSSQTYRQPDKYSPMQRLETPEHRTLSMQQIAAAEEEQMYEERRAEELRRQIRERESELAKLSANKDRLKARIQSTLKKEYDSQLGEGSKLSFSVTQRRSPLGMSSQPLFKIPDSSQQMRIQKSTDVVDYPMKQTPRAFKIRTDLSNSQNEKNYLNMSRVTDNLQPRFHQGADPVKTQYMHQLSNDNANLQKRLTLVTAELERVERECEVAEKQLLSYHKETQQYQRAIDDHRRFDINESKLQRELDAQRDENRETTEVLQEMDSKCLHIVSQLNRMQEDRQRRVADSEELSADLQKKLQIMQDFDQKKLDNIEQHQILEDSIKQTEWAIRENSMHLPDIRAAIEKLTVERDGLLARYHHLSVTNEHGVSEISRERAQIEAQFRRHIHFIAAKALAVALQACVKDRRQRAMNEFVNYCKFDEKCHKTLKSLSNVMENCGKSQLKFVLKQWFTVTLKPYGTRVQKEILAEKLYRAKLKSRMLKRWQKVASAADSVHETKLLAICKIKQLRDYDALKDQQQAFAQWFYFRQLSRQREKSIKYLLKRQHTTRQRQVFYQWRNFCIEIEYAIKNHLLMKAHATKSFTSIAFSQLKERTAFHRRKRLMRLRHLFKAWQDSNQYRRYIMGADVAAAHILRAAKRRLLQACYDQLKFWKQCEQYECMRESLAGNFVPALAALDEQIRSRASQAFRIRQIRSLETLVKHTNHITGSYFNHWSLTVSGYKHKLHKNLKAILLRLYQETKQRGFNQWRQGHNWDKIERQRVFNYQLTKDERLFVCEVKESQSQCHDELMRQQRQLRYRLQKAVNMCVKRHLYQSMQKWSKKCIQMRQQEHEGAGVLLQRLRKYWLRRAFRSYCEFAGQDRAYERGERRCLVYLQTRQRKSLRKVFDALSLFVQRYIRQKQIMDMLLTKIDVLTKRKTIQNWLNQGHTKQIQIGKNAQNENTHKLDVLNSVLGKLTRRLRDIQEANRQENKKLKKQGERCMSNHFARFYYIKAFRGFGKWKDVVDYQKHRERIIQSVTRHQHQSRFYVAKAAWQNWISQTKAKELKASIQYVQIKSGDTDQMNLFTEAEHIRTVEAHDFEIQDSDLKKKRVSDKLVKTLKIMIRRNGENHYQGLFRSMFVRWRAHTKRQLRFLQAVTKTVKKSMWQNGLDNIREFARDKHLTRTQNTHLRGMRRIFWRKCCGNAVNLWRRHIITKAKHERDTDNQTTQKLTREHDKHVNAVKEWTAVRSLEHLRRRNLANLWQAWLNVTQWKRTCNQATEACRTEVSLFYKKRALAKWSQRVYTTHKINTAMKRFREFKHKHLKMLVIKGLARRNKENRTLSLVMGHLARKFDNQYLHKSFDLIRAFGRDKQQASSMDKVVASRNLAEILARHYAVNMNRYLGQLRSSAVEAHGKYLGAKWCLTHCYSTKVRDAFNKFKYQTSKETVVEDVNTEGPVVPQMIEQRQTLSILKLFLKEQGYTQGQITEIAEWCTKQSNERLNRVISFLRHQSRPRNLKPRVFNRWIEYVQLRKHVNYNLRQIINKLQPVKCDLSYAFNRWKFTKKDQLQGVDFVRLAHKAGKQKEHIDELVKLERDAIEYARNLEIQRDELVGHYMGGQRMVLSLCKSNMAQRAQKALREMADHAHRQKRDNLELVLQRNIALIDSLKQRITQQENHNIRQAAENQELRQFSLDGYQIAQSIDQLQAERASLQMNLGDQERRVLQLRVENQELLQKLKDAQERAIVLINHSTDNMRRLSSQR